MAMPLSSQKEVTQLLDDWSSGDERALEKLDEAYLLLVKDPNRGWHNRTHFIAATAQLMRRIMVDHARARRALKRGGEGARVTLDEAALITDKHSEELVALDEALGRLGAQDPRKSQIVELRYFGGLTVEETAQFLKMSRRSVDEPDEE